MYKSHFYAFLFLSPPPWLKGGGIDFTVKGGDREFVNRRGPARMTRYCVSYGIGEFRNWGGPSLNLLSLNGETLVRVWHFSKKTFCNLLRDFSPRLPALHTDGEGGGLFFFLGRKKIIEHDFCARQRNGRDGGACFRVGLEWEIFTRVLGGNTGRSGKKGSKPSS